MAVTMDKIVNLCKRRGFIFPSCELYGGYANTYTYGPYGIELKNAIKQMWWKYFIQSRSDMMGIDGNIILHPRVWEASGHVGGFNDAMVDCKICKARHRADQLIEDAIGMDMEGKSPAEMEEVMKANQIRCPKCGNHDFTGVRKFNMMFKLSTGSTENSNEIAYLRPETAQAIFMTFNNVIDSMRVKLPFGIGQIGKAFRNEITPGNFIYRLIEFEQMEIEYFLNPSQWQECFDGWQNEMWYWTTRLLHLDESNVRIHEHPKEKLSHYSQKTIDIEYRYPFGFKELYGLAYRTDFDLRMHSQAGGKSTEYFDSVTNQKYIPHVIEPTFGVDRSVLVLLLDKYDEEDAPTADGTTETRVVLRLPHYLAPVKIAVLPLLRKAELTGECRKIYDQLRRCWNVEYDETQSIGKRYRRQDEIGTPFVVTFDFDSLQDQQVTIRERDSMKQIRVPVDQLVAYFHDNLRLDF